MSFPCSVTIFSASPLRLDYFNDYQSFQYGINSIEPFQIRNESYIAITSIKSPVSGCTPCIIMKHSNTFGKFIVHQYLATSGGSKFRAFSAGDDTYLFLGNKEDGCLPAGSYKCRFFSFLLTLVRVINRYGT